jgi:hypothetical protein
MTERLDAHNTSVDTTLAQAGACARIHLPTGWICALPHRHRGSCQFRSPGDLADAEKGRSSTPGRSGASCS